MAKPVDILKRSMEDFKELTRTEKEKLIKQYERASKLHAFKQTREAREE